MLLLEPARTRYDLQWRMAGIHVRVNPMFWLFTAIFGWDLTQMVRPVPGMVALLLWILVCFVSILLHELGHVWMGQFFGSSGHIVLYSFGGLAVGSSNLPRRWERILVYFAGPGIQLLLYAGLKVLTQHPWSPFPVERGTPLWLFIDLMLDVNLFWPLLNLLPIWPLDGGRITREVCEGGLGFTQGVIASLWISLVVAALIAIQAVLVRMGSIRTIWVDAVVARLLVPFGIDVSFLPPFALPTGIYSIIFFGMFAYSNYQELQVVQASNRGWNDEFPWENR